MAAEARQRAPVAHRFRRVYFMESIVAPVVIGLVIGVAAAGFAVAFSLSEDLGSVIRSHVGIWWVFVSLALFYVTGYVLVRQFGWLEGSSTNKFIEYYHFEGGRIPTVPAIIFIVGSLVTVMAGGSVGPEGPALILGGFLGYTLARRLFNRPAYEAKEHALIGAGAAVAAVFKAPFTAMTFVLEVLYRRDLETGVFLETVVATVTAYLISVALTGPAGIVVRRLEVGSLIPSMQDIVAGIIAGLAATLVSRVMVESKHLFVKLSKSLQRISIFIPPTILASIIWLGSRRHPYVLGGGEHVAAEAIHRQLELSAGEALWASIEKAVLTTASLTMGGTGGVFLPLVAIGALLGYGLAEAFKAQNIDVYILASIAGVFAGANSVVISAVLFGLEVLGGYAFIPSALAATIAYIMSMGHSLHTNQLPRREVAKKLALAELLHRLEERRLLDTVREIPVSEAVNRNPIFFYVGTYAGDALRIAAEKGHVAYPVVDKDGKLVGFVQLEDLIAVDPVTPIEELVREPPVIDPRASIFDAAVTMIRRDVDRLFVVDRNGRLIGLLSKTDMLRKLMKLYERSLEEEIERAFE